MFGVLLGLGHQCRVKALSRHMGQVVGKLEDGRALVWIETGRFELVVKRALGGNMEL